MSEAPGSSFLRGSTRAAPRRRGEYENGSFLGDRNVPAQKNGCLYDKGCKGSETHSDCPTRKRTNVATTTTWCYRMKSRPRMGFIPEVLISVPESIWYAATIMHELGIASEIYRVCRASAAEHGSGQIESVRVLVGEFSAVEPEQLRFAWEAVTQGGPDEGASLEIDWRPAEQFCATCDEVAPRPAGGWLSHCPSCEGPLLIRGGDELDIVNLSVTLDVNNREASRTPRA